MTEKDFRKLVTDLETSTEEKLHLASLISNFNEILASSLSDKFTLVNVAKGGSLAKGVMLTDNDSIDILITIKVNNDKPFAIMNQALLNEIENIMIYNFDEIIKPSDIEKLPNRNIIRLKVKNYIVNLLIRYVDTPLFNIINDEKQIAFTELCNRDYTYFRNALMIIKYYRDSQQIAISGYILEILLYYSLNEYFNGNRYESYLYGFMRALDDFVNGKKIDVSSDIYQKLEIVKKDVTYKKGYIIVDFTNQDINLTQDVNDVTINDYRKLKKALAKLVDTISNVPNATSAVVSLDINPILDEKTNNYSWCYVILNTNIRNNGGSYQNNIDEYFTSILKGFYKGLRAIIDNNLNRKGIELICKETNILKKAVNYNDENKSRVKTIQAFIEANNITFKN